MSHGFRTWRHRRRLTRARVSPWLASILVLLWCLGISLGYLLGGLEQESEDPGGAAQQSALTTWDRVYQVNAALTDKPRWLQWLLAYEPPSDLREQAKEELLALHEAKQLNEFGRSVLAGLILSSEEKLSTEEQSSWQEALDPAIVRLRSGQPVSAEDRSLWVEKMAAQEVMPWEREWLFAALSESQKAEWSERIAAHEKKQNLLMVCYVASSAAFAIIFLFGLCCVGSWLKACAGKQRVTLQWPRHSYASRIALSLMLTVLILTEWVNGLLFEVVHALGAPWQESWWWVMITDTLWRILPVLVMLWFFYRSARAVITRLGLNQRPAWRMIAALYAVLILFDFVWNRCLEAWGVGIEIVPLDPMEQGWSGLVYGLISACLMAPLAEECFYRGFLFRSLQPRLGFWVAALLSSIVFAVSHFYDVYGTVSVACCGMATAWLYAATRSLVSSILLHALYNLSITIPSWVLFHAPW